MLFVPLFKQEFKEIQAGMTAIISTLVILFYGKRTNAIFMFDRFAFTHYTMLNGCVYTLRNELFLRAQSIASKSTVMTLLILQSQLSQPVCQ